MTAISLNVPQSAQLGQGQGSAQLSRATTIAASSPSRHPGSFPRQTMHAMSYLQAQYAEASASASTSASASASTSQPNRNMNGASSAHAPARPGQPLPNDRRATSPTPTSLQRPSSAPGDNQGSATNNHHDSGSVEGNRSVATRPAKPPLLRSKSEYRPRYDEADDRAEEEYYDLSARHGFEDHYLSEDIIAQLANVSDISVSGSASVGCRCCRSI